MDRRAREPDARRTAALGRVLPVELRITGYRRLTLPTR